MEKHRKLFKNLLAQHQKVKILKSRDLCAVVTVHDLFFISSSPCVLLLLDSTELYNTHQANLLVGLGNSWVS